MKKTVVLTLWMFLLAVGLLSWLIYRPGRSDIVYIGPPAPTDTSARSGHEAIIGATKLRKASSERKLAENNTYINKR